MLAQPIIKSLIESSDPVTRSIRQDLSFNDTVTDTYKGEVKGRLTAHRVDQLAGYIDYTRYDNNLYIDFITVNSPFERQGIATAMVDYFVKEYKGYDHILWGNTTEDGSALKAVMDKRYNHTEQPRLHRIPRTIINAIISKDFVAGLFLTDLVEIGADAFNKWDSTDWLEDNMDIANDLSVIAEWIEGSNFAAYNHDRPGTRISMPDHIIPLIASKFKLKLKGS